MAKKKQPITEPKNTSTVTIDSSLRTVTINGLVLDNSEVYSFFMEKENPSRWMEKSIVIGTIGLKQMTIAENVDFVEKEFRKFLADARKAFDDQQTNIDEKLKLVFDMKNSSSMIAQFKKYLDEQQDTFDIDNPDSLFAKFKEFMEENQESFSDTVDETFSLDNKKSQFAMFQAHLDKSLDMHHKDSPLNQFKELIEEYFDDKNGKIHAVMQSYFDERKGQMKLLLDKAFDIKNKESSFSKLLDEIRENTDVEEETIKGLLDPNKTDSPIQLLKNSLLEEFEDLKEQELKVLMEHLKDIREKDMKEIREHLLQEEAAEEMYSKSTAKGQDFEADTYIQLTQLSSPYEDEITRRGGETGTKGKIGDITIDIDGDESKRIVVECKDDTSYRGSVPKTLREAKDAIENRKGKYCLFVFKEQDLMPPQLRPMKITDEYLITSAEGAHLHIAYRLARLMLQKKSTGDQNIDIEAIQKEIDGITATIGTIAQLQSKVTQIANACDYIDTGLNGLHRDIEIRLGKIQSLVQACTSERVDG